MNSNTKYENLINHHLKRFPQDQNFVKLLLQNEEFLPEEKSYGSWLKFNLNSIERGEIFISTIEKKIGPIKGLKVLDVGAGSGGASIAFYKHGCDVTAVEIDDIRLKWLKSRIKDHKIPIQIINQPIEEINFTNKYDLIYCNAVLEHVFNWKSFLHRLLEINQGHIYLSWPNKYSILEILSDSHYRLFGATFLTGKLRFLQKYYLKMMKIKRNPCVISVPTLFSVKKLIAKNSNLHQVAPFFPSSFEKIQNPERINYKPARIILIVMKKLMIPCSFMVKIAWSIRKTREILISKVM
ncbi:MAG: methyltransferase domain-containing protein [Candidatus Aminicenantes bacterium]|nr:methyltransferase domain-containing protein [Candidatus Aminicenantes bacterium]NIM78333.1 methyltransferase domain-containing protein [Candidatus Aminicenantes bacterium]NIN17567.1 methyltransferase domain-containing protein [Candidatus Aminicenantes bacterium]NIN84219.1 methyltransferase domain-containing protein [Candidatus Aminicenantes bacterium]NIO80325.1 methyltransferase domain-containing protein [Candidatus Aminicenantes bacterium]